MFNVCRNYNTHSSSVTDTDDTDEEEAIGGQGIFSHGKLCLTHQHWVAQVVVAGGFNVHCTQSAEASHKLNMHLASKRARHLDANYTQSRMLIYLRWFHVFETLYSKPVPQSRALKTGVTGLLQVPCLVHNLHNPRFVSVRFQRKFLHPQVRVAGVEFLNLLCDELGLRQNRDTYARLQALRFLIGSKFTRDDGNTFWAADSRRDILRLKGLEEGNSLCCETICFIHIDNVTALQGFDSSSDSLVLVLVRWFSPHVASSERDLQGRPLCPGPFSINNCIWAYSRTPGPRRALVNQDGRPSVGFGAHAHFFGQDADERDELWQREKHAYYGLVRPNNILHTVNMAPTFQNGSDVPDYSRWLETVTMT